LYSGGADLSVLCAACFLGNTYFLYRKIIKAIAATKPQARAVVDESSAATKSGFLLVLPISTFVI
jgi:hypothetical protein